MSMIFSKKYVRVLLTTFGFLKERKLRTRIRTLIELGSLASNFFKLLTPTCEYLRRHLKSLLEHFLCGWKITKRMRKLVQGSCETLQELQQWYRLCSLKSKMKLLWIYDDGWFLEWKRKGNELIFILGWGG